MRPAWARSWRCKSSHELTTASEAKRNCARATERGKEARSETASRGTRTGSEAKPSRASGQRTAKLSWSRLRRRKSGGCAGKDRVLTWGDLALCLKGRRGNPAREVSRGRSSRKTKGRRNGRGGPLVLGFGNVSEVRDSEARHPTRLGEARMVVAARNRIGRISHQPPQEACRDSLQRADLNCSNRPVRTRMPGGVGGARSAMIGPYPDCATHGRFASLSASA